MASLAPGPYTVEFLLEGFTPVRQSVRVDAGATALANATLSIGGLRETVQVSASAVALEVATSTQSASFSNEQLTELPSASRNYTHVIVAEAGVNAPLPDRTGKGLNIATAPGTQAEDASQSLNPSVNGARPTNNGLRINGIDATNMLNASGSLGASVALPLEALEEVEMQTALPSAASGRNGGGNLALLTRAGGDRFSGSGGYYFQHEKMNANEFFLNRAGVAKPEFRRNDATATLGGPLRRGRTTFFGAAQRQVFKSGYASNANAATGLPTGLTDVRDADDDCRCRERVDAHRRRGRPALRAELHERPARVPGGAAGRPHRQVLRRSGAPDFPGVDAGGHSSGGAQHPEHQARRPVPDSVAAARSAGAAPATAPSAASTCSSR